MSQLLAMLGAAAGSAAQKTYVDDVFSAYTYTGTGSAQTINNGIDLAGKGGLVWTKQRAAPGTQGHMLTDTARGANQYLQSNNTSGQSTLASGITSFNSNGFTLGTDNTQNTSGASHVAWTFRKAPKFFDVVTYTGNGTFQNIPHSLGVTPGMVIVKCTSAVKWWAVQHRSVPATQVLQLNATAAAVTDNAFDSTYPTATTFSVFGADQNAAGSTYVAYLFAHDTAADGLIQCGSVTSDANRDVAVTLGWEPQFILFKRTNSTGSWQIADSMRKMLAATTGTDQPAASCLQAEASNAESNADSIGIHATGFKEGSLGVAGDTYIYLAIRRPNKPPTSGTQVFNAIARTGTGAVVKTNAGFPVDLFIVDDRVNAAVSRRHLITRLTAGSATPVTLDPTSTAAESASIGLTAKFDNMTGIGLANDVDTNGGSVSYIDYYFRRAPGVFDVVCYTGAVGALTINHALGVVPELVIAKVRSNVRDWVVYFGDKSKYLQLNTNVAQQSWANYLNTVTATTITVNGSESLFNESGEKYVAYLFATKAGISKVGSYTGNGSFLAVNCGFSAGSRFVMIKRTDAVGDWFVWDSARGITASIDPRLSLNTTAAEVNTDSSLSPWGNGFEAIQNTATNINVNNATYIYLAIA